MKNKKWINYPWIIGLGTSIFSFFLAIVYDYLKGKPIFNTILQILKGLWNFIILALNYKIKLCWLILVIVIIIAFTYLVIKFRQEEIVKPDYCNYRGDKFKIWKWSWDWEFDRYKKTWHVTNLTANCPNCDTRLIESSSIYNGILFECPRCNFKAEDSQCEEPYKIEALILDNVNRNRRKNSA